MWFLTKVKESQNNKVSETNNFGLKMSVKPKFGLK